MNINKVACLAIINVYTYIHMCVLIFNRLLYDICIISIDSVLSLYFYYLYIPTFSIRIPGISHMHNTTHDTKCTHSCYPVCLQSNTHRHKHTPWYTSAFIITSNKHIYALTYTILPNTKYVFIALLAVH